MPTFVKTRSFSTNQTFNSDKDDAEVNRAIQEVTSKGGRIDEIRVLLAGTDATARALYVILYEASAPL